MRTTETKNQTSGQNGSVLGRAAVRERVARNQGVPFKWIRDASPEDLEWTADELLAERDERKILAHLRVFARRDFPRPAVSLVGWAQSQNIRIAGAAAQVLSRIGHPEVRALALALFSEGERPANGVRLLQSNFQQGDFATIERLLAAAEEDEDAYHILGFAILDLLDHAPAPLEESRNTLLQRYENDPCSHCRKVVVSNLVALDRVPGWMAEECRYDSVPEIAALFSPA